MPDSKQFLGVCSATCSHCNTAVLPCQITVNPDLRLARKRRSQQAGHRVGLIVTHFGDEPSVGNRDGNVWREPPVDIETVGAAVQRQMRIMRPDFGIEVSDL